MFFSESNIKKFLFISAISILSFSCYLFNRYFSIGVYSHYSWKCWLISILLLLITFLPLSRLVIKNPCESLRRFSYFHFRNLWFFVSFLLIIAAGLFFRLYKLDCFPWGLEGLIIDSAGAGEYAFKILSGEPYYPIGSSLGGVQDTLPTYPHVLFFSIFGPTLFALRCETVFIGLVNAVLVFFAIKVILRNGNSEGDSNIVLIALAGMGLYLFSSVDTVLNYSAFEGTITTPIALAGFLSLIWAFKKESYFSFCLAGLFFGLLLSSSKYFIPTAPAFIIVIAYYAISNFFGRFKTEGEGSWWYVKIGIFFLGALFVVLPKLLCLLYTYDAYFFRILLVVDVGLVAKERSLTTFLNSFISKLSSTNPSDTIKLMFLDGFCGRFLLGINTTIVDKVVTPIFFLGIIYSLIRIKKERYLFLVCYLCCTIVLCIITFPVDYRFIPFMPFVYIFFSIGLNLINKLLKYRKAFYILAGIYLIVIVSFNVKNYYTGMGIAPLVSFYHVKDTLVGRYLQNNFLDKRVYVSLGDYEWVSRFFTYNCRERDINRPTSGVPLREPRKSCDDFTYKMILSNISRIVADNLNSEKDILFVFDDTVCNEEIVSRLESILNKNRSSFSIYSKSCKENFTYSTFEIKKDKLASISTTNIVPQYAGKRYGALKEVKEEGLIEGLAGKYYADTKFEKLVDTRIDKCIDFNWQEGSPLPSIKPDYFSIEWNGYIWVDADETYWFFTKSDDGVRLWIDDDLIIDNWNPHVSEELYASIFMEEGLHKIKLQYFESEGLASVSLWWASKNFWKSIVSHYNLFCISEE